MIKICPLCEAHIDTQRELVIWYTGKTGSLSELADLICDNPKVCKSTEKCINPIKGTTEGTLWDERRNSI